MGNEDVTVPRGAPTATSDDELRAGAQLGRYVILHPLGAGGAGEVFAARDTVLLRTVALKLLRRTHDRALAERQAALVEEARVCATIAHPNVVTVFDVGEEAERIYLSMEQVEGQDLRAWLGALTERGAARRRAIVQRFVAAGRGLAAAHAAGVVHRDFKPANVLVGSDGRVRVTDFGISAVRTQAGLTEEDTVADIERTAIVGTPAYMAPEQHVGVGVDHRADIYAFCFALLEALWGVRPIRAETVAGLREAKLEGTPARPSGADSIPRGLEQALRRGIDPDPAGRPSALGMLLDEIERYGRRSTAPVLVGALAVGAAAAVAIVSRFDPLPPLNAPSAPVALDPCAEVADPFAEVWNADVRDAVEAAFLETGEGFAPYAFRIAARGVDARAQAWLEMATDACAATWARAEQSQETLELRMGCLGRRLEETRALLARWVVADSKAVELSGEMVEGLAPVSRCADVETLARSVPPPEDPSARARTNIGIRKREEIKALIARGEYDDAVRRAASGVQWAEETGFDPLTAEAHYWHATALRFADDMPAAEKALHAAVAAAQRGRHDAIEADAWLDLVYAAGTQKGRHAEGRRYAGFAEAAMARLKNEEGREARLKTGLAAIAAAEGAFEEALAAYEAAVSLESARLGADAAELALPLQNVGNTLSALGRYEEALQSYSRSLEITKVAHGEDHPRAAAAHAKVGLILSQLDRHEDAEPHFEKLVAIREATRPDGHPDRSRAIRARAIAWIRSGRHEDAAKSLRDAIRVARRSGEAAREIPRMLNELCSARYNQQRWDDAVQACQRAVDLQRNDESRDPKTWKVSETRLEIVTRRRAEADGG